jgi:flagellar hook-associated protein 2
MAGSITAGGLATGLDTARIIEQLVGLERRPLDLLARQAAAVEASKASIATLAARLAALQAAARSLGTVGGVLALTAASSDARVLAARAGTGATPGGATITVASLARPSVAASSVGLGAADAPVAALPGSFAFQVGAGPVQTVAVDATTTLQGLADTINRLGAGVTARAVDVDDDFRLEITSDTSGAASTITIVQDDTALAITTAEAGEDARFTVGGLAGTFARAANTITDILPGVTVELSGIGTATVMVRTDADAAVGRVRGLVDAFNALVGFVTAESAVHPGTDGPDVGSLAADATVRRLVDRVQEAVSRALPGASGRYLDLASIGITTRHDGTLALDETRLRAALAAEPSAVAALFAGNGPAAGVASTLDRLIGDATGSGGVLALHGATLDTHLRALQERIDAGQRAVDAFERDVRRQFAALEQLVASLEDQASFLRAALGGSS